MKRTGYWMVYSTESHTLSLHVDLDLVRRMQEIPEDCRYIDHMKGIAPGYSFCYAFKDRFGFDACMAITMSDGYMVFECALPKAVYSDQPCSECKGSGVMLQVDDRPCYFCKGAKKEMVNIGADRYAVCLTFSLVFWLLEVSLGDSGENYAQHAVFASSVRKNDRGGMGFGGGVSAMFISALIALYAELLSKEPFLDKPVRSPSFVFSSACEAMVSAWARMSLSDPAKLKHEMRATLGSEGLVYVECPGENGCSVSSSSFGIPYYFKDGKSLNTHNVDTSLQQIALMVGFAKVYEEVIKKII